MKIVLAPVYRRPSHFSGGSFVGLYGFSVCLLAPVTVSCSLKLIIRSYLHRPSVNSNPDDLSSVDSEIDEGMEEAEKNLAIDAEDTAYLAEVNASNSSSSKIKRNEMVRDLEPRMKKVSVEMRKMRKERWSLDTVGSSGDESVR